VNNEMMNLIISTLGPTILTLLSGLVSWGLIELTKYIRTKTKNEAVNDAVAHICHTVDTTVKELAQTTAAEYKNSDGSLSKDAAIRLKFLAIKKVKNQVPDAIMMTAGIAVNSVNQLISAKIEKAVFEMKGKN